MIEIVCPNCGARYQVPAQALGDGRDVTCSSCNHVWHARPPQAEAPPPPPPPPAYEPEPYAGSQQQSYAPEPEPAADPRDRRRQMADIRQMLDEVQTAERRRAEATPPPAQEPAQRWDRAQPEPEPEAPRQRRRPPVTIDDEEEDDSRLRERVGARARSVRERARDGEGDRRRMLDRHARRERRKEEAQKRGSGWGWTGFTLIVLMFGVFTFLYALHPALIERNPAMAPALENYVDAVETLRVQMADGYAAVSGFIAEKIGEAQGEG